MRIDFHSGEFYGRHCASRRGPWGRGGWGGAGPDRNWRNDWFGEPPARAERGGVRYLVLDAIADRPRHGYEVISAIEERSKGSYRPSPGVIYPTLQMLDELGHARSNEQEGRRVYEITDTGRADLESHRAEVDDFYDRLREDSWESHIESVGEVMRHLGRLIKTFKRASRHGRLSSARLTKTREIIDEAVHKLERLFEEDD